MASIGESGKMGTSTHAGKTRAGLSGSVSAELSRAVYKGLSAAIGQSTFRTSLQECSGRRTDSGQSW